MTTRGTPSRATILLFTWAAGSVDAITYLTASVFTANMTGNAVLLAVATGQMRSLAAVRSLIALLAFIAGVVLGALLTAKNGPGQSHAGVRRAVLVETLILAVFAAVAMVQWPFSPRGAILLLIGVSGLAMGVQSATVRRLSLPGIATTYITGTITFLFSGLVQHWSALKGGEGAPGGQQPIPEVERSLALQAEVFIAYTVSALITAVLHMQWASAVTVLPLAAIAIVAFTMHWRSAPVAAAP